MISLRALTGAADSARLSPLLAAAVIFLSAFLLFQVELLIAKLILPWFGGSAAVWVACLLFFQVALLGGYAYAHLLATRLAPKSQARLHLLLMLASLAFLPILPREFWKPSGGEDPLPLILGLLAATIGLPFLMLSATAPLLQDWIARDTTASKFSIYRLYALSNLGSMLALISYPLLVEPLLPARLQALIWSGAYAAFALLSLAAAFSIRAMPQAAREADEPAPPPAFAARCFWVLLPAAASALLLSVSNHFLRNVAAIPLFWMVPLALYLLSFIIVFEKPSWYWRPLWLTLFIAAMSVLCRVVAGLIAPADLPTLLALYSGALFVFCMACHGEMERLKPAPRYLTAYYLSIAAGGALGGIYVAVLAPSLFRWDADLAIVLAASTLLVIAAVWLTRERGKLLRHLLVLAAALLIAWDGATTMAYSIYLDIMDQVYLTRNFYGALRVQDTQAVRTLSNGAIVHGREYNSPGLFYEPVSYYSRASGVGIALTQLGGNGPLRVGAIGLGAGTIAAYARPEDSYRFYEINPAVPPVAREFFHYLERCESACEVVLGDARLSLEREAPQAFDLLAVDAFSGDSVPVHLLTREAFALYWRHLKPGGVLAVHATNRYIDLSPIVALPALEEGRTARSLMNSSDDLATDYSEWILVTKDASFFTAPVLSTAVTVPIPPGLRAWTDDFSNLWRSLR